MYEHTVLCKYFTRLISFKLLRITQWILPGLGDWKIKNCGGKKGLFYTYEAITFINTCVYRPLHNCSHFLCRRRLSSLNFFWVSPVTYKQKTTQQKKYWKTTHWDTNVLACYQWSVTFNFFLGACSSSHWSQWAFHYQLQWELAQASVIFLLDWQGMQTLETQHVELLMGGNNTSAALWLIKKWALNVNSAQLLQGQQP